ncbi:DUF6701 domain-containing protein [Rhodoferax saidenbachensis]|nr:DUF6701 domain-containing protein [Rhodoferax saidenbachensis]
MQQKSLYSKHLMGEIMELNFRSAGAVRTLVAWLLGLSLALGSVTTVYAIGYTPSITTAYPQLTVNPSATQVNWTVSTATCNVPSRYNVCDDGKSDIMSIGFNFTFAGVVYNKWSMSTNGVIFFETAAAGGNSTGDTDYTTTALPTTAFGGVIGPPSTVKAALMPFWADLQKNASVAGANNSAGQPANASFYQYEMQTVSGKQVLVVQLKNAVYWNTSPQLYVNLQVQLWSTGEIVYSYGAMQVMTTNPALRIGLQYPGAVGGCNTLANNQSTSLSNQSYLYTWDAAAAACPPLPTVNHYEIRHDGASTLCAEPVTVLACSSGTTPCPSASIINTQIINVSVAVTGAGSLATPNINPASSNIEPAAPSQAINITWASGSSGAATFVLNTTLSATNALQCTNVAGTAAYANCRMTVANTACIAPPHHYEIQGPASGTTCANHTFTIKAWANAAQTTAYTAGVTTGTLTASGNPASMPSLGAFTIASGSSTVDITPITFPSIGTTTFSTTATPALAGATTCNFGGSTSSCAFTVAVGCVADFNCVETSANAANTADSNASTGKLYTKLAGTAFTFDVVARKADGSVLTTYASEADKSVTVELVDGAGATVCASRVALVPAVNSQTLTFAKTGQSSDLGRKSISFTAANAYQNVRCRATDATSTSTKSCSSDNFAIRPSAVTLVTTANAPVPSVSNPTGTATTIFKAGGNFTLRATTSAGTNYAGTLDQDTDQFTSQDPTQTTKANGGTTGTLTPASLTGNATAAATAANATYTEVGYLYLGTGAFADTSYTAVDNNANHDCIQNSFSDALPALPAAQKYGCNIGNTTEVSLGRFIPDRFETAVSAAPIGCPGGLTCPANPAPSVNGFVYANQPLTVQVIAKNTTVTNATTPTTNTTQNYRSNFAKATTLSAWSAKGGATANPGGGTLANTAVASEAFIKGVASVTPSYGTTLPTLLAPTDVYFRAAENAAGGDGVTSLQTTAANSVEAGLKLASGRFKIDNAYGSERLALPIVTTVQYYTGATWVTSLTDNATTYNSALTTATPTPGNVLLASAVGLGAPAGSAVAVVGPASAAVVSGVRTFRLAAPMSSGKVNISVNTPIYLPSVSGLATFGVFRSPLIYRRENY